MRYMGTYRRLTTWIRTVLFCTSLLKLVAVIAHSKSNHKGHHVWQVEGGGGIMWQNSPPHHHHLWIITIISSTCLQPSVITKTSLYCCSTIHSDYKPESLYIHNTGGSWRILAIKCCQRGIIQSNTANQVYILWSFSYLQAKTWHSQLLHLQRNPHHNCHLLTFFPPFALSVALLSPTQMSNTCLIYCDSAINLRPEFTHFCHYQVDTVTKWLMIPILNIKQLQIWE